MKKNGKVYEALSDRQEYVLQSTPTILAGLLFRRDSTPPNDLVTMAISCTERIYDIVNESDTPTEAMLSQPVTRT